MKPLDPDLEYLLRQWLEKADADLEAAETLAPGIATNARLGEVVGFRCQQTTEKHLKALLTFYQIEFPKTHEIDRLLAPLARANPAAAKALGCTKWLAPFAVDIRYPGDAAEMVPGDEVRAIELARFARTVALRDLHER